MSVTRPHRCECAPSWGAVAVATLPCALLARVVSTPREAGVAASVQQRQAARLSMCPGTHRICSHFFGRLIGVPLTRSPRRAPCSGYRCATGTGARRASPATTRTARRSWPGECTRLASRVRPECCARSFTPPARNDSGHHRRVIGLLRNPHLYVAHRGTASRFGRDSVRSCSRVGCAVMGWGLPAAKAPRPLDPRNPHCRCQTAE